MTINKHFFALALTAASLFPLAAFADDDDDDHRRNRRRAPPAQVHIHNHDCHHGASNVPVGVPTYDGHYEVRTVQKWVPGYYARSWVPEICESRGRHGRWKRCRPGYYSEVWQPGRYQTVQEQVWVPVYRNYQPASYSTYPSHPGYQAQVNVAPVAVDFTFTGSF